MVLQGSSSLRAAHTKSKCGRAMVSGAAGDAQRELDTCGSARSETPCVSPLTSLWQRQPPAGSAEGGGLSWRRLHKGKGKKLSLLPKSGAEGSLRSTFFATRRSYLSYQLLRKPHHTHLLTPLGVRAMGASGPLLRIFEYPPDSPGTSAAWH